MSEDKMEIETTPSAKRPVKSKLVDADNTQQDLPDPKRTRVELDADQKSNVMDTILATYIRIAEKFVTDTLPLCRIIRNVALGDQIMSAIYSAHLMKRQEANGYIGKITDHKDKKLEFTCENYILNMTLCEIAAIMVETFTAFKLKYLKPKDGEKNHWFGVIAPLLTFLCAHKLRRDELRVGHGNMPVNKTKEEEKYVTVKSYGLEGPHHILLEGISFPPEKRSSMTQSLGLMTTAIMLSKHGNSVQFGQKWKDVLARDCAHIPEIVNSQHDCREIAFRH